MNRSTDTARQEIRSSWRQILDGMTSRAKKPVNGEPSYICPFCNHGKNGDGLTLNPKSTDGNGLHCFGCGFSGDIIDLYQKKTGADFMTALSELAKEIGITIDDETGKTPQEAAGSRRSGFDASGHTEAPQTPKTPQSGVKRATEGAEAAADYTEYYKACRPRRTDPAAAAYLTGRGISGETAEKYGIGFDPEAGRIILPSGPSFYTGRSIDPNRPPKYLNPKGSRPGIFNERALYDGDTDAVFVTEGAFDALSVIEAGGSAIAMNSANNDTELLKRIEARRPAAAIVLYLDDDTAGRQATQRLQEGLQRLHIPFYRAEIPGGHHDPNDALQADRSAFAEAIQEATLQAVAVRERQREEARRLEQERRQRTGEGMVDSFLEAVRTRKYEPVPTGITDIDKAIGGGFIRQQIILLGAAPGAGKTSFAQWVFEGMAAKGKPCLFLNLEMSRDQMLARSLSRIAAQNGDRIAATEILQGYKWTAEQEEAVAIAAEQYRATIAPQMIYNPDGVTADLDSILEYIESEAQRAEEAGTPVPCIVLDYLQIIRGREREDSVAIIKRAMGSLKDFAIRHNTFVFAIMAQSRTMNKTGDSTMEAGRDTSALEYGADIQLGLAYTRCLKKYGNKDADELTPEEKKQLTLKITKGRWGGPGREVNLYFDGETMTYKQLAPDYLEDLTPRKAGRQAPRAT